MTIDRRRWADMRRNSRIGLVGSLLIGVGGGAWLILAALLGDNQTSVVPGILLVLLGIGAGLSFRAKRGVVISEDGAPLLFRLDRAGLEMDIAEGGRVQRDWGDFELHWLHKAASYLELSSDGLPTQEWPVVVTDVNRPDLARAIEELSDGHAALGTGHRTSGRTRPGTEAT